jgi:hypothetical protein
VDIGTAELLQSHTHIRNHPSSQRVVNAYNLALQDASANTVDKVHYNDSIQNTEAHNQEVSAEKFRDEIKSKFGKPTRREQPGEVYRAPKAKKHHHHG